MRTIFNFIVRLLRLLDKYLLLVLDDILDIVRNVVSVGIKVSLFVILYKIAGSDFVDRILSTLGG